MRDVVWLVFNCVCACFLWFNVCVWFVRNVLCDVVWFVVLCVLSVFVSFVLSVFVRFACDVWCVA